MKTLTPASLLRRANAHVLFVAAVAMSLVACGRKNSDSTSGSTFPPQAVSPSAGAAKLILAGSVPEIPGAQAAIADGFIDSVTWDSAQHRVNVRGWAALDARAVNSTLIVRDPFGLVTFSTAPVVRTEDRPDVAAARSKEPELLHAGFTLSLAVVAGSTTSSAWEQSLEIYALPTNGKLTRLTRGGDKARPSWERRPDSFSVVLVHATPSFGNVARKKNGNLDALTPDATASTATLVGWADFDGASPQSTLVIQLPPSSAPASIVSYHWISRPDVAQTIDPTRSELARSGFEVVLAFRGAADDLRKPGALRMWSLAAEGPAVPIGTGSLNRSP